MLVRRFNSQSLQRQLHRGTLLLIHALRRIRIENFRCYRETPSFRRDVNYLPLRHREGHHVQMAAVAQHQRQSAHVSQRFRLLGFLRFSCAWTGTRFGLPVVPIVSALAIAFAVSLVAAFAVAIIGGPSLLVVRLLALYFRRLLFRVLRRARGFISRRRKVISAHAENINHSRRRTRDRRRIAAAAHRRADRREHAVARILSSQPGRQSSMARRYVCGMNAGPRANDGAADSNST